MSDKKSRKQTSSPVPDMPGAKEGNSARLLLLKIETIRIKIKGVEGSSMIQSRLPDELIGQLVDKQGGKAALPRGPKDGEKCFRASAHLMPGSSWEEKNPRFGFPAIAFKKAMVQAANDMGMKQTEVARWFHILGDGCRLVEIDYKSFSHRTDGARNKGKGGTSLDVRHRLELHDWSAIVTVRFNASVITAEQIVNLMNAAGFGIGVGEWRVRGPNGGLGVNGMFEVAA